MTTEDDDRTKTAPEDATTHSDDEENAHETSPLLPEHSRAGVNPEEDVNNAISTTEQTHWRHRLRRIQTDIGFGLLFSIPLLLLVPALVFFVMTLNLRATLPPSSTLETISNLTNQVSHLSKSLSTCNKNTTNLAIMLHDEQQRVEVCRESERRLAARIDIVEDMLDKCQVQERALREQLEGVQGDLGVCEDEKEELKRQMESGVFVQFLTMVGKMGTGGDSWVCSDTTPSWSNGYATDESPHSTIKIQTWTAELNDVDHSTSPLIFPPNAVASRANAPAAPAPSGSSSPKKIVTVGKYGQLTMPRPPRITRADPQYVRVLGYTVTSLNTSGNNGWWRTNKLESFGTLGVPIEFFALAAKWYGSKARFEVTVYWVPGDNHSFV